jgi:hypothetical protein
MATTKLFLIAALLLPSVAASACPACRPVVEAGIYNADFIANFGLLILPIAAILLLAGVAYKLK